MTFFRERAGLGMAGLLLLCFIVITGCAPSSSLEKEASLQLKILYWDKDSFMQRFGNYMSMEYPNLEFEVVPLKQIYGDEGNNPDDLQQKLIIDEHFDLVFLKQPFQYDELVKQNRLSPIDSLFKESSDWNQSVMEQLKRDGTLYGYTPTYFADALYVNQSLFEQQGVPLMDEAAAMDWDQWFQLVNRFSSDTAGLTVGGGAASFALRLGAAQGLTFYPKDSIVLATPEWERIFDQVRTAFKNRAIQTETSLDPMAGDAFEQGKAAMKFETSDYYRSLEIKQEGNSNKFQWTVIPFPNKLGSGSVNPPIFHVNEIIAIPNEAVNKEQAKDLLRFITGDKMTKILQQQGELTTRNFDSSNDKSRRFAYLSDIPYMPLTAKSYDDIMLSMPENTAAKFRDAAETIMKELLESDKDMMEGLKEIEAAMRTNE